MRGISLKNAAKAVGGVVFNDRNDIYIEGVSTDTREDVKNKLFIPIRGDNFDGHFFLPVAIEKGASCLFSQIGLSTQLPYVLVEDTNKALMDLAAYYKSLFDIPVVAITGSVGKTTTKDMVASILSQKYNVVKNIKNYNNAIGLPLTIFNIDEKTEILVVEMGMNSFGEIHNLSKIARPNVCVITNIGIAHIGNLGSREGIFKAKCEIFDYMENGGAAVLNGDDDMLTKLTEREFTTLLFSADNPNSFISARDIKLRGIEGVGCLAVTKDKEIELNIPSPGKHMVYNALAAAAVGLIFEIEPDLICEGIRNYTPSENRMDIKKAHGLTIINDVYNSNPISAKAVLEILTYADGRKVCVLGDMLELGENGGKMHFDLGRDIANMDIDAAVFIGELSKLMYDGFNDSISPESSGKEVHYFESKQDFIENGLDILKPGDTVLIKASHGMKFEEILEKIL